MFFNIFINDLFLQIAKVDICNYADDTTLFTSDRDINRVISRLEIDSALSSKWFHDNYMRLNIDKCHLITNHADEISIKICSSTIHESNQDELLGVIIDNKLTFEDHIRNLCKKVSNKLYALSRISHLLDHEKLRILMRAFIYSQFQYFPLTWMFYSRKLNNSINTLQERAPRITYRDQSSSFESLLKKDSSTTIHVKNLKVMLSEMFKTKTYQNPDFMREVFPLRNNSYNLRYNNEFLQPKVKTVSYGMETIRVRGPQLWQTLPSHIKSSTSLKDFKRKIRIWNTSDCHCRLCRPYILSLGFLYLTYFL